MTAMVNNQFDVLTTLPDVQAAAWLSDYLRSRPVAPPVRVPFDLEPVEFLLSQVHSLSNSELPRRVGTLAGKLVAEAIAQGKHRPGDTAEQEALRTLFTLIEALPVSDDVAEFLYDLAVSGRLLDGGELDLHLLTLRALVLHQRPRPGEIERAVEFWRHEADDIRYAAIAIQGLLRIAAPGAIELLPEFVRRARAAQPPLPLTNTLFVVESELGSSKDLWQALRSAFDAQPSQLTLVRDEFARLRLRERNPVAWEILHQDATIADPVGGWSLQFATGDEQKINRAREQPFDMLLAPAA
jgi:hypothetical protein